MSSSANHSLAEKYTRRISSVSSNLRLHIKALHCGYKTEKSTTKIIDLDEILNNLVIIKFS